MQVSTKKLYFYLSAFLQNVVTTLSACPHECFTSPNSTLLNYIPIKVISKILVTFSIIDTLYLNQFFNFCFNSLHLLIYCIEVISMENCPDIVAITLLACQISECLSDDELEILSADLS